MKRVIVVAIAVAVWMGCRGEPAQPPPGVRGALVKEPVEPQAAPEEESSPVAVPLPPTQPGGETDPESEEPQERDLAAELQRAVGSPIACLRDYRSPVATTIRINVSAIVRPSGLVIEPTASGPGLSSMARACIERMVGNVVLQPLASETSEPVSTSVSATLTTNFEPGVVVADPPTPPRIPRDVVLPEPKLPTIPPSGEPIQAVPGEPIEGPKGDPIDGPAGIPIQGPPGIPIEEDGVPGY